MKKLFLIICLFSYTISTFTQSEYQTVSKDLAIALKEAQTGFFNIRGKMIDEGEFKVKPNIFISTDNYIEFPSDIDSYAFYSQGFTMASNRKQGKKIIENLIDEARKVIPQDYELTKGESSDFDSKIALGYYGVYAPKKGQELLYVLHHPKDKGFSSNKYPCVVFSLNFRNGKSPRVNMVVFSPSIETLENKRFIKAEMLVANFNYNCLNDLTIDWEKKQFQFEKNMNEWIDYYTVPFENGVYMDYSHHSLGSKVGIKSMTGDNFVIDKGEAIPMDFFWMSYYELDKQKRGMEYFKEIIEVLEIPYVELKYDDNAIISSYDFNKFLGEYNGFIVDTNTNSVDESQSVKIKIDIYSNLIISKKTDDDWVEVINTKLKPDVMKESENGERLYYVFSLEENEEYDDFTATINPEAIANQLGGAVTFTLNAESKETIFFVANRKWVNPVNVGEFSKLNGEESNKIIYTGQTYEDDPWGNYLINDYPELNLSVIRYKNVANNFILKKKGTIYTIDFNKDSQAFDFEFKFMNGKVTIEDMYGYNSKGSKMEKAFTKVEALHAIAKLYSGKIHERTKHKANFTIDFKNRKEGVGIVLNPIGTVYVGKYANYSQANGKGTFYGSRGLVEKGTFALNSREGWFDIEDKDLIYSGLYKNNKKEGKWNYKSKGSGRTKTVVYKNDEIIEQTEWE